MEELTFYKASGERGAMKAEAFHFDLPDFSDKAAPFNFPNSEGFFYQVPEDLTLTLTLTRNRPSTPPSSFLMVSLRAQNTPSLRCIEFIIDT